MVSGERLSSAAASRGVLANPCLCPNPADEKKCWVFSPNMWGCPWGKCRRLRLAGLEISLFFGRRLIAFQRPAMLAIILTGFVQLVRFVRHMTEHALLLLFSRILWLAVRRRQADPQTPCQNEPGQQTSKELLTHIALGLFYQLAT